jgi:hypothetical protein
METIIPICVIAYLAYVFFSSYRAALLKGFEKDLRELETFRKKQDISTTAAMTAKLVREELARELEASRFQAAVQAAVQAQTQPQSRQQTAQPRNQPIQQHQAEPYTWRQQRAQAQAAAPHYEEPPMAPDMEQIPRGEQPVVYNREQDFPEHKQL